VWSPLALGGLVRGFPGPLPFPLGKPGCQLFVRARHALWQGVQALGLHEGDEVLAPAYHHGSEIEALVRAGLSCRFYESSESLEPDEAELESLLGPRTRALHLTHFLGFPLDASRWRRWCDEQNLLLVEDAAQAWLAEVNGHPVGSFGHLSVFCLYKTVGLPIISASVSESPGERAGTRRLGAAQMARFAAGRTLRRFPRLEARLRKPKSRYVPEEDFALGDVNSSPSAAAALLVRRYPYAGVAERRRANYERLLEGLFQLVPQPFCRLSPGASPFIFPVVAPDKEEMLSRLKERGIDALDFWSVPHSSLPANRFPGAAKRRAATVGLPVHQEMTRHDIERVVEAVTTLAA
jgi:dTDP-4-amino-4,6-dideoxygalactose transaminase